LVRPAAELAGLIEIRGLGIRRLPYEPLAVVGLVVDLAGEGAARLPISEAGNIVLEGVPLPRLVVAAGLPALPMVVAFLGSSAAEVKEN
jgi:HPr kinase/phosphorylase